MTDREKLLRFLQEPGCSSDLESIVIGYLITHSCDFSATRIRSMMSRLDRDILMIRILELERAVKISSERATYLRTFLSGEMYLSEDEARQMVPKQIMHAEEIKNVCEKIPY